MAKYLIGNIKGPAGEDGFSPTATVTQTSTGATITVTDANGTTTANIRNGIDGDGSPIDLSDYATKIDLATLQYSVEHAGYATETYVDGEIEDIEFPVTSVNGMVGNVTIPIPDVSNYATKAYVDAAIEEVDGFSGDYDDLTNKPDLSVYAETADLATVATTGDYDDLINKPTIPVLPTLATVATSGSYTDLSNKPAIPIYTAGNNITISNGEISATDTTYTAGTGIDITSGVISATGGGGSGADLDDVAEYLEETYGLSYDTDEVPEDDYDFNEITGGTNLYFDDGPAYPNPVGEFEFSAVEIYDYEDTLLATVPAGTWRVPSQSGGSDPNHWGFNYYPDNNQYGVEIGLDADANQHSWKLHMNHIIANGVQDAHHMVGSITLGGTTEIIGTLNAKFIPSSIATKQDLNNPNMIRGGVEGVVQQAYGMGIQHQVQEIHIDGSAEQMDSSNKAQFYMELQDPSRLLRDMHAEVFVDGNKVGDSMGFQEDDDKYISTYTYKGGNTYSMEYDPSTEYWTVDYDYDEFTAEGGEYINIAAVYYEDTVTYQSLSPEFIPIDNDTITINNGVLVASSGGSGGSGITEDDIKDGLTIEQDHEEGEDYNELNLSADDVFITQYNGDGNEVGVMGFGYRSETEYSEDDGDTISTNITADLQSSLIGFTKNVNNQTQDQQVEQKDITIAANFDDSVIEVEFADGVAGTNETKTIAFVEDLPRDELPTISSGDAGKVLAVNSGETGVEWITASGGGSSDALTPVIQVTSLDASGLAPVGAQWLVAKQAGNRNALLPKGFMYGEAIFWHTNASNLWGQYNNPVISYTHFVPLYLSSTNKRLYVEQINITINPSDGAITAVNTFSLGNWYEPVPTTSDNAASAIYLKDTNNVVYEITVDTSGNLVATAQQ